MKLDSEKDLIENKLYRVTLHDGNIVTVFRDKSGIRTVADYSENYEKTKPHPVRHIKLDEIAEYEELSK